ncbi:diablo, IAP-binding mitochondrial protein a isoform X1 [Rhinichthys klamathensis goyatoka]|uniref:diablo, IAP-binding mitochondrial protein a isoform X1 n=1 Tax=Rhinichthys klamathensis goyatoka TaxID=3034132 RepID=UPI0024B4D20D|nr:diablo, IAP-binding mitochondrial protein a isoform X1 [Rhinichthys klamathensis goyatoka]
MQAFRNCGLCASGNLFKGRTDFLVARRNMSVLRVSAACVQLLKDKTNVFCSSPVHQRLLRLARSKAVAFSVSSGLCAVPFTQQVENLSHESLIRRASCLVTDSANTYLSQTTLALVDAHTQYAKALHTLIALQKRYITSIGKLTPAEEDSIWQVIIGQRVEVSDRLEECKRFESNWMNAIHICELSAEAAYNSGAEHACTATKTNLQVAQSKVEEIRKISREAKKKLAETKAEEIQRMAEYVSSIDINDLEDIPEAYLRED